MSSGDYHCFCKNSIAVVNAKFRAFIPGEKGKEIELPTMESGQLALLQESDNWVKIEFWDAFAWNEVGCFTPVNSGDEIVVDGVTQQFEVTINGKTADPQTCPEF